MSKVTYNYRSVTQSSFPARIYQKRNGGRSKYHVTKIIPNIKFWRWKRPQILIKIKFYEHTSLNFMVDSVIIIAILYMKAQDSAICPSSHRW